MLNFSEPSQDPRIFSIDEVLDIFAMVSKVILKGLLIICLHFGVQEPFQHLPVFYISSFHIKLTNTFLLPSHPFSPTHKYSKEVKVPKVNVSVRKPEFFLNVLIFYTGMEVGKWLWNPETRLDKMTLNISTRCPRLSRSWRRLCSSWRSGC